MHNITDLDLKCLKEKYRDDESLSLIIKKIEEEDYPVQYAIGNVDFWNVVIKVDERVLIPRFATELLACKTVTYMKKLGLQDAHVVDLCTGSGAIAIAIKNNLSDSIVEGIDISEDALNLAKENATLNEVDVSFEKKDVLQDQWVKDDYSVLISNPPYVRLDEKVSPNTRYEPSIALYPGNDELIFYKSILKESQKGNFQLIAFEIGAEQGEKIINIVKQYYPEADVKILKDFEGFLRYVFIFVNKFLT